MHNAIAKTEDRAPAPGDGAGAYYGGSHRVLIGFAMEDPVDRPGAFPEV